MGEDKIVALIQESLNVATRVGAAKPSDFTSIIVDTTVQPKAVAFPTDAKLMHAPARSWRGWPKSTASSCDNPTSGLASTR